MLLEGKNAIVTGGSQGIGTAASIELAREGANVCLTYRTHEEEASRVKEKILALGYLDPDGLALVWDSTLGVRGCYWVTQTARILGEAVLRHTPLGRRSG